VGQNQKSKSVNSEEKKDIFHALKVLKNTSPSEMTDEQKALLEQATLLAKTHIIKKPQETSKEKDKELALKLFSKLEGKEIKKLSEEQEEVFRLAKKVSRAAFIDHGLSEEEKEKMRELKVYEIHNVRHQGMRDTILYQTYPISVDCGEKTILPVFLAKHLAEVHTLRREFVPTSKGPVQNKIVGKKYTYSVREVE